MSGHFYTTNQRGELAPANGYEREGIAFYAYPNQQPGTVPLFRLFGNGNHFYTTSSNEANNATTNGYTREGVACFVYTSQQAGTIPIYRWFQSGFMSNFAFSDDISFGNRLRILERHSFAYFQIKNCTQLSSQEKDNLRKAYKSIIIHGVESRAGINASADIGLKRLPVVGLLYGNIRVNIGVLFPQGDIEIAQTLIHEMMHVAGYEHPNRCDAVNPPSCPRIDQPFDNGKYYGTAPLRAELCIAGNQNLTTDGSGTACIREDDTFSIAN